MEKINVAELLKNCPRDMKLDCTMYDNLYFDQVCDEDDCLYPIGCYTIADEIRTSINFTEFGGFNTHINSKCVIFPEGKTTWDGFVPPCKFKVGDVVTCKYEHGLVSIILRKLVNFTEIHFYCALYNNAKGFITDNFILGEPKYINHATEEEKQKLFDTIKANGYKWNEETKTLEKLPKFEDGDILYAIDEGNEFIFILKHVFEEGRVYCYLSLKGDDLRIQEVWLTDYNTTHRLATEEEKQKLFDAIKANGYRWSDETKTLEKLIEPKFKVGDKVRHKITNKDDVYEISKVYDDSYGLVGFTWMLYMKYQDNYELVPNKFDINTLVPFESKVLVRHEKDQRWIPAFWGGKCTDGYTTTFGWSKFCIPFDGNEHLLNSNKDCDDFFKTWE